MISKELLSEISGVEMIEVYEMIHKCKEWLSQQDINYQITYYKGYVYMYLSSSGREFEGTEEEAIIAACEWVLQQESCTYYRKKVLRRESRQRRKENK